MNEHHIDDKKPKEEKETRKEERMKEVIKKIVKPNVISEEKERAQKTQELLEKLPHEVLEMYAKAGGTIHITDKELAKHDELKDLSDSDRFVINSKGNKVSLESHMVFAKSGEKPSLIIRTDDYAYSYTRSKEVYYELGKAIIRDVLENKELESQQFIGAMEKIKNDTDPDARYFLFSTPFTRVLASYDNPIDTTFIRDHVTEFQHAFAEAFAHYFDPSYRKSQTLRYYANAMFEYMKEMDQKRFTEINDSMKEQVVEEKNGVLDFKNNTKKAIEFGKQIQLSGSVLTELDEKSMNRYVVQGPMLNRILRGIDKHPGASVIDEFIAGIDQLFTKKEATLPKDVIVYRRTDEKEFGLKAGSLFFGNGNINLEAFSQLKKFEGKIITDKGFISTSLAVNSIPLGGNQETIRLRIKVPKGTPAIYMDNSWYELVLNRDTSYKITQINGIVVPDRNNVDKIVVNIEAEILPENK